jgi:hypothetical protein
MEVLLRGIGLTMNFFLKIQFVEAQSRRDKGFTKK